MCDRCRDIKKPSFRKYIKEDFLYNNLCTNKSEWICKYCNTRFIEKEKSKKYKNILNFSFILLLCVSLIFPISALPAVLRNFSFLIALLFNLVLYIIALSIIYRFTEFEEEIYLKVKSQIKKND